MQILALRHYIVVSNDYVEKDEMSRKSERRIDFFC